MLLDHLLEDRHGTEGLEIVTARTQVLVHLGEELGVQALDRAGFHIPEFQEGAWRSGEAEPQ
jgi:hypothetical protein